MGLASADIETRITDWVEVADKPEWGGSSVAAYRIWQQRDGHRWFQRHEWRDRDGSVRLDDWISGAEGFSPSASPAPTNELAAF